MRVVCPKCELKGQVDAAPSGAKTRIACVRCATTFDAVFADGEIQALLPQASHAETMIAGAASEVCTVSDVPAATAEFVSTPETPHENWPDDSLQFEASPAEVDDFSTSSPDLIMETAGETAQGASQEISEEDALHSVEPQVHETADAWQASVAATRSLKSNGTGKVGRLHSDGYGMGVRLMRVSPLWLLLVGLSFISFIVFCNWLIKPTEQPGDMASLTATANNHSTNQSANRVTVASSTAQSSASSQVSQQLKAPGVAFIATEAKEASPTVATPNVAAVEVKPTVEEKPAIPASSSNPSGGAKEGKITIQIGSYNAVAEAEARVANLKSAGFEARSIEVDIPKRGTWYRVQSGRFVSRDEAERYGKQLRDKGVVASFITTDVQE